MSASRSSTPPTATAPGRVRARGCSATPSARAATGSCSRPSSACPMGDGVDRRRHSLHCHEAFDRRLAVPPDRRRRPLPAPRGRPRNATRGDVCGAGRARPPKENPRLRHVELQARDPLERARSIPPAPRTSRSRASTRGSIVGAEADLLPTCERLGLCFIPHSPIGSGLLTGKIRRDPPGHRSKERDCTAMTSRKHELQVVERLTAWAEAHGVSAARSCHRRACRRCRWRWSSQEQPSLSRCVPTPQQASGCRQRKSSTRSGQFQSPRRRRVPGARARARGSPR